MMEYNGNKLDQKTLDTLLKVAEELNVPPSYLITKLHYEGLWGGSTVAKANNNLSGMTWTGDPQRPSGVVVEKGSARPAREGGHYMKYKSIKDFMKDWTHLIRRGGIYKVADSETFDEAVKGMFQVGGAKYDYATMNVQDSKQRYELYLKGMKARRQAINNANNNILDKLDGGSEMATATKVLNVAKSLIGTRQRSAGHQKLVNEYNSIRPNLRRPNGGQYTANLGDDWCDIFITVIFKRAGALNLIDAECGVQHHMNHLKKKGIWQGRVKPRPGDIVIFDWHGHQSGWADHIGIVEKLSGNTLHTIEGNVGGAPRSVARRTHVYNGNTIVGYARPRYTASTGGGSTSTTSTSSSSTARARGKSSQTVAAEVLAGVWGNGDDRKKALQAHGYNYNSVQAQVNKLFGLKGKSNAVLAKHVIDGDFSTSPVRQEALKAIGANASNVQKEVNKLIAQPTPKKSVREVAQEIVDGKGGWGNNPEREQKLKAQGYDPKKVQAEVNKIMKENTPQKKTVKQVAQEIVDGKGGWGTNPTRAKKLADAGYNAQQVQNEVNKIMKANTPQAPREEIVEAPKNEQTGNTPVNDKLAENEVILDGVKYIIQKVR